MGKPPEGRGGLYALVLFVILGSIAALLASCQLQDDNPWWSSVLVNLGVALLLIVPAAWVGTKVLAGVDRVGKLSKHADDTAKAAVKDASDAKALAERTAKSVDDISSEVMSWLLRDDEVRMGVYSRLLDRFDRQSLIAALRLATERNIISEGGVRTRIWETTLYYRFVLDAAHDHLEIRIEDEEESVLSTHEWTPQKEASSFAKELADALEELGVAVCAERLASACTKDIVEMFQLVERERLKDGPTALRNIVQKEQCDASDDPEHEPELGWWYFTEEAMVPAHQTYKSYSYRELFEGVLADDLLRKQYAGVNEALATAKVLYKRRQPPEESRPGNQQREHDNAPWSGGLRISV